MLFMKKSREGFAYCHSCEQWKCSKDFMILNYHATIPVYRASCNRCIDANLTLDNLYDTDGEKFKMLRQKCRKVFFDTGCIDLEADNPLI